MILVDDRAGSGNLISLFPKGKALLTRLEYGDFAWVGNGQKGEQMMIGVERKQIREVCSTIVDHRFIGHQLPGLLSMYKVVYLIVEGRWRGDPETGILQEWRGKPGTWMGNWKQVVNGTKRFMAGEVTKFVTTVENKAGVRLRYTEDVLRTVQEVMALHSWWTVKEWEEHRAHLAIQYPLPETVMLRKPSLLQMWAACLPGVEWKRSIAVCKHFKGPREMANADEKEWRKVEGIGKGLAAKIVGILQRGGRE